ncbi:MAG: sulfotransferase domain-containing protein [Planctomycetaceae bacterium]|nr:sulfotransferase domain-containing protein [Planctomycetaceae bacterium]
MKRVQGVSYPRSGHAIVYNFAREYFGKAFVYCDAKNSQWCGCDQVPCVNPACTFAKNHDFELRYSPGIPLRRDERYLIQYRTPVHSICSNFHLYARNHPDQQSLQGWRKFAYREIHIWNHFVDKWVLDFPEQMRAPLYCTYDQLIENPHESLRQIAQLMSVGSIDEERCDRIVDSLVVESRNSIDSFGYYDPGFFRELEQAATQRLDLLELPCWDAG